MINRDYKYLAHRRPGNRVNTWPGALLAACAATCAMILIWSAESYAGEPGACETGCEAACVEYWEAVTNGES